MRENQQNCVQVREHKKPDSSILLEIELNNPKKLNVLNLDIIYNLNKTIKAWQNRTDLSVVFIHSAGEKAFCAGGDVVEVYSKILEYRNKGLDPALAVKDFFQTEYETDYMLFNFQKPVILWGNGIVMGGGMGLFMASSYPILTETSRLAMPEISIGFFPDVGASYFLNQIPQEFGRYLALTGCHLNASEACFLNLTNWTFLQKDKPMLFDFLKKNSFKNKFEFHNKFNEFYKKPQFLIEQNCWIKTFKEEIVKALKFKSLEAFYDYFSQIQLENKKWEKNRQNFLKASPRSLALIFEQLKRSKNQKDLKVLFEMEMVIALHMARSSDLSEGVRALLIDKTDDPQWSPNRIEDLEQSEIDRYFQEEEGWNCSLQV